MMWRVNPIEEVSIVDDTHTVLLVVKVQKPMLTHTSSSLSLYDCLSFKFRELSFSEKLLFRSVPTVGMRVVRFISNSGRSFFMVT